MIIPKVLIYSGQENEIDTIDLVENECDYDFEEIVDYPLIEKINILGGVIRYKIRDLLYGRKFRMYSICSGVPAPYNDYLYYAMEDNYFTNHYD